MLNFPQYSRGFGLLPIPVLSVADSRVTGKRRPWFFWIFPPQNPLKSTDGHKSEHIHVWIGERHVRMYVVVHDKKIEENVYLKSVIVMVIVSVMPKAVENLCTCRLMDVVFHLDLDLHLKLSWNRNRNRNWSWNSNNNIRTRTRTRTSNNKTTTTEAGVRITRDEGLGTTKIQMGMV